MKNKFKIFIYVCIITIILLIFDTKEIKAFEINEENISDEQQAIIDISKAFYYRGKNIQYFSSNMTYKNSYGKKSHEYHSIPEDATDQNILNFDCTSFIYNVFENAFVNEKGENYKIGGLSARNGASTNFVNLADKTKDTYNSEITIFYTDNPQEYASELFDSSDTKKERKDKFINKIGLLPGDVIVYKNSDGSGHGLIYLGDDIVINSSQMANNIYAKSYTYSIYNSTNKDLKFSKHNNFNDYGTIGIVSFENNVTSTTANDINKYIFSSSITKLAILRPLNEVKNNGYTISNSALKRKNISDLIINKTASVGRSNSVNLGDKITYTIKLENVSSKYDYNNIVVSDIIPSNTEFISLTGDGTIKDDNLSWNISLNHGDSKIITYTVKVKRDKELLKTYISSDSTKVNDLKINTINTYVNSTITNCTQNKIIDIVKSNVGKKYNSNENIANIIYTLIDKKFTLFSELNADDFLNMMFTNSSVCVYQKGTSDCNNHSNKAEITNESDKEKYGLGEKKVYILKEDKNEMYVDGLFGGLYTLDKYENYNINVNPDRQDNRIVRIDEKDFMIGDILVIHDDDYEKEKETLNYIASEKGVYLYVGDGNFATINENGELIIIDEKAWEEITKYDSINDPKAKAVLEPRETNRSKIIESLPAQNTYIVLRPSYKGFKGLLGDVDCDGLSNKVDAKLISKYIVDKKININESDLNLADVNNDGLIKINDVISIIKNK